MKQIKLIHIIVLITTLIVSSSIYASSSPTDIEIVEVIESNIELYFEDINDLDIFVNCHDGVVTYVGTVENQGQIGELIDIAASTPGVTAINTSDLKVFAPPS